MCCQQDRAFLRCKQELIEVAWNGGLKTFVPQTEMAVSVPAIVVETAD
jgi:hypothetical protein